MWARFLKSNSLEKNILVLGQTGCGKRSFLLCYKDGESLNPDKAYLLPECHTMIYHKGLDKTTEQVQMVFTIHRTHDDKMIPSITQTIRYDLILILTDLSSEKAKSDLDYYRGYVEIHFPGVKTIFVGTKQDQQLESNALHELIATSVKTKHGFEKFEEELLQSLGVRDKAGLDLK